MPRILELSGKILSGAREGRAAQERLLAAALADFADVIELDFAGVEFATASYLREAVFGVRSALERDGVRAPVIVLNASPAVEEDLAIVARSLGTAIASVSGTKDAGRKGRVLGVLEEAQRDTLSALAECGEASATELHEKFPSSPPVLVTAWNNRLAALASKGVVFEVRSGREKRYRLMAEELEYGR